MVPKQREVLIAGVVLAALVASVGAAVAQSEPRTSETLKFGEHRVRRGPSIHRFGGPLQRASQRQAESHRRRDPPACQHRSRHVCAPARAGSGHDPSDPSPLARLAATRASTRNDGAPAHVHRL